MRNRPRPLFRAGRPLAGFGGGGFDPTRIASLEPSLVTVAADLWQDSGKTVPAVGDGDPVRVAVDPWSLVEWTAPSDAARPLLADLGGGSFGLVFDGVDDQLVYASPAARLRLQSALSVQAGYVMPDAPAQQDVIAKDETDREWSMRITSTEIGVFDLNGGGQVAQVVNAVTVGGNAIHSGWWDGSVARCQVNGGAVGTSAAAVGTDGTDAVRIGNDGFGNFFAGTLVGVVCHRGGATDRANVAAYLEGLMP